MKYKPIQKCGRSILGLVDEVGVPPTACLLFPGVFDDVKSLVLDPHLSELDGEDISFPAYFQELLLAPLHFVRAFDQQFFHVPDLPIEEVIFLIYSHGSLVFDFESDHLLGGIIEGVLKLIDFSHVVYLVHLQVLLEFRHLGVAVVLDSVILLLKLLMLACQFLESAFCLKQVLL